MKKIIITVIAAILPFAVFAEVGETSLFAGVGNYWGDGNTVPDATIDGPRDVIMNPDNGDIFIAEGDNHIIRKIDGTTGVISTLAGSGEAGYAEGIGANASFNQPASLALDRANGIIYAADSKNNRIRGINIDTGETYLVAGSGYSGGTDGNVTDARFNEPWGIAFDSANNHIYVSDTFNNKIRKIDPAAGTVITAAGAADILSPADYVEGTGDAIRFNLPRGIDLDETSGTLYIADSNNFKIRAFDISTAGSSLVAGTTIGYEEGNTSTAKFNRIYGLRYDASKNVIYTADTKNYRIREVNLNTYETALVAGSAMGYAEGEGDNAEFYNPYNIFPDPSSGSLLVADHTNDRIRKVDLESNSLTSVYMGFGAYGGDGNTRTAAMFNSPRDVAVNTFTGRAYVADTGNNVIRMIDENGMVSTIAGTGDLGYAEGPGDAALFNSPRALALDYVREKLYVCDTLNNRIRVIDLADNSVSLVAGGSHPPFYQEGTAADANFYNPEGIALDIDNNIIYVADTRNHVIRAIDPETGITTHISGIAGTAGYAEKEADGENAAWNNPKGILYNKRFEVLIIGDTANNRIRRIGLSSSESAPYLTYTITGDTQAGYVDDTLKTSLYDAPAAVQYDDVVNRLYISDTGNRVVRLAILFSGGAVGTLAGDSTSGYKEGVGLDAKFGSVNGTYMDFTTQTIYIADAANNRIRLIDAFAPTFTPLPTDTSTATLTPTYGDTFTITPTHSITETKTPDYTFTATPTYTASPTASESHTVSPTPSITRTVTLTLTETATQTRSLTFTATPTGTQTAAPTAAQTSTVSETVTQTRTQTPVFSETATLTAALTEEITQTATPSVTQSITGTPEHSVTVTAAETPQESATGTQTASPSLTETAVSEETPTITPSATRTEHETFTETPTITLTQTPSFDASATATPTMTNTPEITPTNTPVDFFGERFYIYDNLVYPNPSHGLFILKYSTSKDCRKITVRIYTSSFRLIRSYENENIKKGEVIQLYEALKDAANGIYHYLIEAWDHDGERTRKAGEIIILR
ncbi:MAG: hypothetical protein ACLFP1_06600 [Candidatus Goldiibacteriota bacterium]